MAAVAGWMTEVPVVAVDPTGPLVAISSFTLSSCRARLACSVRSPPSSCASRLASAESGSSLLLAARRSGDLVLQLRNLGLEVLRPSLEVRQRGRGGRLRCFGDVDDVRVRDRLRQRLRLPTPRVEVASISRS